MAILLDSSYLLGLLNTRDAHHEAALEARDRMVGGEWGQAILSEYVFLEAVTVLAARRSQESAVRAGELLLDARETEFIPMSEHFNATWDTFRRQREPRWSFTDAALVTLARERGIGYIATFDTDFRDVEGLDLVPE